MRQRPDVLVNMAVTADGKIDTVERRGVHIPGPGDTADAIHLSLASATPGTVGDVVLRYRVDGSTGR